MSDPCRTFGAFVGALGFGFLGFGVGMFDLVTAMPTDPSFMWTLTSSP